MPHDAGTLLEHVRRAARLIEDFVTGRSLADYGTDAMLHAAVEREFTIIGEALSRLEKLDSALAGQINHYREIIGFRNVLVHGYDAIDDQIVWGVIQNDLPALRKQAEGLLAGYGQP
jgi:uncharacterized protein with HEPN domain